MGNWITVNAIGKVDIEEARVMIDMLKYDNKTYTSIAEKELGVFYLQFGKGVFGLNQWINEDGSIFAAGNVFERDCDVEDLVNELSALANKFTSLDMELHIGDWYESLKCVATVKVKNGIAKKFEPQIDILQSKF